MKINDILTFLEILSSNNNKDWFKMNQKYYKDCKDSFQNLIEILINEIIGFDEDIKSVEAKKCIFRIHRDVRFSNNKLPYKTNFGALISKGGKKNINAGYYIHLEPNQSFIGGGIYMPNPKTLYNIRKRIYHNPNEFIEIINETNFKNNYGKLFGEKLKTAPRGFDKSFKHIDLLNHKHFVVTHHIKNESWNDSNILNTIISVLKSQLHFNKYLNDCVDNN